MRDYSLEEEIQHIINLTERFHLSNRNDLETLAIFPLLYAILERVINKSIDYLAERIQHNNLCFRDLNDNLQKYIYGILFDNEKSKGAKYMELSCIPIEDIDWNKLLHASNKPKDVSKIAKYFDLFLMNIHEKISGKNFHEPIKRLHILRNQIAHGELITISHQDEDENLKNIVDALLEIIGIIEKSVNDCCDNNKFLKNSIESVNV